MATQDRLTQEDFALVLMRCQAKPETITEQNVTQAARDLSGQFNKNVTPHAVRRIASLLNLQPKGSPGGSLNSLESRLAALEARVDALEETATNPELPIEA